MPHKRSKADVRLLQQLEHFYDLYNRPGFIPDDPVSIPHKFTKREDIEIMGFFAAILAWGQRKTIINSCNKLITLFDGKPHDFVMKHRDSDLKPLLKFVHRTFNGEDLISIIGFLKELYTLNGSMERSFEKYLSPADANVENAINGFRQSYIDSEYFLKRSAKHIAGPASGSACKRINMYLRWMVRNDGRGVDFGIWSSIQPNQLVCPLDVHVINIAEKLGLLNNPTGNWRTAVQLTDKLKSFDALDPVKFDFALFGMGVNKAEI